MWGSRAQCWPLGNGRAVKMWGVMCASYLSYNLLNTELY